MVGSVCRAVVVGLVLILAAAVPASARAPHAAQPRGVRADLPVLRMNTLVGETTWVSTLDPVMVVDIQPFNVLTMISAGLVRLAPNGRSVPDLATWRVGAGGRRYIFTIRPNARFSNGDAVTAQDVDFTLTRALAKSTNATAAYFYLSHIVGAKALNNGKTSRLSGVRVLNARQVQITLDRPIAFFLEALGAPLGFILDERVMRGKKSGTYVTNTCTGNVGAGPFKFVCRNGDSNPNHDSFFAPGHTPSMTVVPNPYYYGRKPHIKIVMPVIPNNQTNYSEFLAGQVDSTALPTADIAKNRGKPGFYQFATSAVEYLAPNFDAPPFNNIHCRLAVSYAVDRDTINQKILHGTQVSIYDVVPRGLLGYYAGKDNPHYNPQRARAELRQCPGGIHNVSIPYADTSVDIENEYAALGAMWAAVGIGLKPKPLPLGDWGNLVGDRLQKSHTAIVDDSWLESYPDPQDYCTHLLRGGQAYNIGDYNDPTYNRLVDRAEVTLDPRVRARLYRRAQHIALSQAAWTVIGNTNGYQLVRPGVHGFVGSQVLGTVVPRNGDWANVTVK